MIACQYILSPQVPDLAALGASRAEDLLGTGAALEGADSAHRVARSEGAELWRCPLPGTPGADGRHRGRPRGGGTGWIYLRRYCRPPMGELLRARLLSPRSESLAQREWNLLCHLRSEGVSTPEPLAQGEPVTALVARRSFLVTRALEDCLPAPLWFAAEATQGELRRRGLRALGLALRRIFLARVELSRLRLEHLHISVAAPSAAELAPDSCSAKKIARARSGRKAEHPELPEDLRWRPLPDVFLTSVRGARIVPKVRARRVESMLRSLYREGVAQGLTLPELRRVGLRALPRETGWGRQLRRRLRQIEV